MYTAIGHNNMAAELDRLIKNGVDINGPSPSIGEWNALQYACHCGNVEWVDMLLKSDANVNMRNMINRPPLHIVCTYELSYCIIPSLLQAGTNLTAQDDAGRTPLHIAAMHATQDNTSAIKLLLEAGADVSIMDYGGNLPQDMTEVEEIKFMIKNFGGGRATKAAL